MVCRPLGDEAPVSELTGLVLRGLEQFPTVTPPVVSDNGPWFTAYPEHKCATLFHSGRDANAIGFGVIADRRGFEAAVSPAPLVADMRSGTTSHQPTLCTTPDP